MTGRWMMAVDPDDFAIMPALVYWFAGFSIAQRLAAITIGTLVAFTTLQTRLFFPIGSLLGVQVEVQSSLALFDRIFEYLDHESTSSRGRRRCEPARRGRARRGLVPLRRRRLDAPGRVVHRPARHEDRARGRDRLGQDDLRLPRRAALRRDARHRLDRRRRRARPDVRALADTVGVVSQETYLFHAPCARTCASRSPTRPTRRSRTRRVRRRSTS
jgi:ATP-binding cassette subfamily B protein